MEYHQHYHLPDDYIKKKISEFLNEDMPDGDITTNSIISENTTVKAKIYAVSTAKDNPPIAPSHVLLGDILVMSFVFPNNEPKT